MWVKVRRTQYEYMSSALPSNSDIARRSRHFAFVPTHKVAALQPAAREQEPRGRKPAERTALAGFKAPPRERGPLHLTHGRAPLSPTPPLHPRLPPLLPT